MVVLKKTTPLSGNIQSLINSLEDLEKTTPSEDLIKKSLSGFNLFYWNTLLYDVFEGNISKETKEFTIETDGPNYYLLIGLSYSPSAKTTFLNFIHTNGSDEWDNRPIALNDTGLYKKGTAFTHFDKNSLGDYGNTFKLKSLGIEPGTKYFTENFEGNTLIFPFIFFEAEGGAVGNEFIRVEGFLGQKPKKLISINNGNIFFSIFGEKKNSYDESTYDSHYIASKFTKSFGESYVSEDFDFWRLKDESLILDVLQEGRYPKLTNSDMDTTLPLDSIRVPGDERFLDQFTGGIVVPPPVGAIKTAKFSVDAFVEQVNEISKREYSEFPQKELDPVLEIIKSLTAKDIEGRDINEVANFLTYIAFLAPLKKLFETKQNEIETLELENKRLSTSADPGGLLKTEIKTLKEEKQQLENERSDIILRNVNLLNKVKDLEHEIKKRSILSRTTPSTTKKLVSEPESEDSKRIRKKYSQLGGKKIDPKNFHLVLSNIIISSRNEEERKKSVLEYVQWAYDEGYSEGIEYDPIYSILEKSDPKLLDDVNQRGPFDD